MNKCFARGKQFYVSPMRNSVGFKEFEVISHQPMNARRAVWRKALRSIPLCHKLQEIRHSDRCAGSARRKSPLINGFRHLAHPRSRVCGKRHGSAFAFPAVEAAISEPGALPLPKRLIIRRLHQSRWQRGGGALTGTLRATTMPLGGSLSGPRRVRRVSSATPSKACGLSRAGYSGRGRAAVDGQRYRATGAGQCGGGQDQAQSNLVLHA